MTGMKEHWHGWLKTADTIALAGLGLLGAVITATAFIESYGNLVDYLLLVHMAGWRAKIGPLGVDAIVLTGELLLFVAVARKWETWIKAFAGTLIGSGLSLSVAMNIGHLPSATWQTRATSALWPVVLATGLAAGLIALKRVSESYQPEPAKRDSTRTRPHPSSRPRPRPAKQTVKRGRPPVEVDLPAGALAAAVAQGVTPRQFGPWLADNYPDAPATEISRYKAGQLLDAARSNGHAGVS